MPVDSSKVPRPDPDVAEAADIALNRLCKWRTHFAGWQLGTRPLGDPEGDAVRDQRELTMLMRAELSALVALLLTKGVFTGNEWAAQLREEADFLSASYERRFPGVQATESGLIYGPVAAETMKDWKP